MMTKKITKPDKVNKMSIKRAEAIELWRSTHGHISNICSALGISRTTFYEWMKEPEFSTALIEAEGELNDEIRDALIAKAADGDMTAIIFYLKSRHPDFKPQPFIQQNLQVNNYSEVTTEQKDKYGI